MYENKISLRLDLVEWKCDGGIQIYCRQPCSWVNLVERDTPSPPTKKNKEYDL